MNVKLYIGAIILCVIGLTSCEDKLDLKPYNEQETEIALNTPTDYTNLMKGAYGKLLAGGYYGGEMLIRPDILSDNLIINQNGRQTSANLYRLLQTSESATWMTTVTEGGEAAFIANLVMENLVNLTDATLAAELEGEALAMRALVHFDMARVLCKAPNQAGGGDLGYHYKSGNDIFALPSRGNVADIYASIVADLEAAKSKIADDNGQGRLNKYAVYGLLSRAYLYMGDYANARDNAQYVLDNSPYNVTPRTSFSDVWDNAYNQSTIFKLVIDNADNISVGVVYGQTGAGTRAEYLPDFDFYNMYTANDIRTTGYFEPGVFEGNSYNFIIKYKDRPASPVNVVDAPVLRMDEVVLNLAEALANIPGNDGAALAALDMLRAQRYSGFASGGETGAALMAAIKMERRLELAFEGHRAFDLKRWGEGFTRSNNGEFADGSGTPPPATATTLAASDHRFLWPISQYSLNVNPNLEQNPGY